MISMVTVRMVAATPDPERLVCRAARGDYMKEPPWTKDFDEVMKHVDGETINEKVTAFVAMLMTRGHWGPFEHPAITLAIEGMSRVTLAQLTRHRIASFDIQSAREVSLRTLAPEDFVWPPSYREEAVVSREAGRREITLSPSEREKLIEGLFAQMIEAYSRLVDGGVPKEDARYLFPLATPVNGTMTVNARSLMHIIALRSLGDSQWEIRELASKMLSVAKEWMPITFKFFEEEWMPNRNIIAP